MDSISGVYRGLEARGWRLLGDNQVLACELENVALSFNFLSVLLRH